MAQENDVQGGKTLAGTVEFFQPFRSVVGQGEAVPELYHLFGGHMCDVLHAFLPAEDVAEEIFNHLVDNYNIPCEDLMDLVERLYKIEHSVDAETQLFGFLLKVKTLNFTPAPNV